MHGQKRGVCDVTAGDVRGGRSVQKEPAGPEGTWAGDER